MSDLLSYAILGFVQGVTEFLPVSSSGHLVVAHELLGVFEKGLAVDAVLQLATVLAVVVYFWKDLLRLASAGFLTLTGRTAPDSDRKLLFALIIGSIPAFIVGIFLEDIMETAFRSADLVAYALIVGSAIMFGAEHVSKKRAGTTAMDGVSPFKAFVIGIFQSLALIPGMSRSGMTISGGLFLGLSRTDAARFGFLLAVPIIAGSGLKKLIELYGEGSLAVLGAPLLMGSITAFISGFLAIHILLMFVRTQPLYIFVVYRLALAGVILLFI